MDSQNNWGWVKSHYEVFLQELDHILLLFQAESHIGSETSRTQTNTHVDVSTAGGGLTCRATALALANFYCNNNNKKKLSMVFKNVSTPNWIPPPFFFEGLCASTKRPHTWKYQVQWRYNLLMLEYLSYRKVECKPWLSHQLSDIGKHWAPYTANGPISQDWLLFHLWLHFAAKILSVSSLSPWI